MNHRNNIIVWGLAALAFAWANAAHATAAYLTRASLDGLNSLTVAAGNASISMDDTTLGNYTYRVASSWVNNYSQVFVIGPTGEPGYEIALASLGGEENTAYWLNASLVFRIDAPAGKVFSGGTIAFVTEHMGAFAAGNLVRWRAATFASEPPYYMDGSIQTEVDFSSALSTTFFTVTQPYPHEDVYENLTLNLPTGVSSFYAVLGAPYSPSDNSTLRFGGIQFNDVTFVPEPSTVTLLALGGFSLAFWRSQKGKR